MNDPRTDLKDACAELQRRAKAKEIPDRQLVRVTFLALGRVVLEENAEDAALLAEQVRTAAAPLQERWDEAVESEMALAVAEYFQSVDPRYLDHPSYDFHYTVTARERLEARLKAMEVLDLTLAEGMLDSILDADQRLAPYLARRENAGE